MLKNIKKYGLPYWCGFIALVLILVLGTFGLRTLYLLNTRNNENQAKIDKIIESLESIEGYAETGQVDNDGQVIIQVIHPATDPDTVTSLTEALMIMQGQYDSLSNYLTIFTIFVGLFTLILPIFNYAFLQRDQVNSLKKQQEDSTTELNETIATLSEEFNIKMKKMAEQYQQVITALTSQKKETSKPIQPVSDDPKDRAWAFALEANIAYNKKDYAEALRNYSKAIELAPKDAGYYNNRGNTLVDMKRYEEALEDYNKAIEIDSEDAGYYNNQGIALAGMKRYEEALNDYNKAIEINPKDAYYYYNRGITLADTKRYDEALEDYNKAIEIDPENASYYNNRGTTFIYIKQYQKALEDANYAIKLDPNSIINQVTKGEVYYALKKYDVAIEQFEKCIKKDDSLNVAYSMLGLAVLKKELVTSRSINEDLADEIRQKLNMGIEKDPDNHEMYLNRAEFYLLTNQSEKAMENIETAKSLDVVGDPELYHLLARIYDAQGNEVKAKENYDKADELGYIPEPDEEDE